MLVHSIARFILAVASCGLILAIAPASESDSPSKNVGLAMDALAKRIALLVKEEKHDAVALGAFVDRSTVPSNAGPGLIRLLSESLRQRGIQVRDNAPLQVGGEYYTRVDKESDRQAVVLRAVVRDDQKRELLVTNCTILGARAVASMLALTVEDLPPDEEDQDVKIRLAVAEGLDHIDKTRVFAGEKSPYAVEILVKQDDAYVPLRVVKKDGRAFVPLKKDDLYAVRLVNNSAHDAAVTLSLDGLSVFAFKEEEQTYSHILIPAKRSGTIKGWYRTRERADAFTITGYAESAAARALKYPSSVGTITATFAVAWKESEEPPDGENSRSADIATGRGPNVDTDFRIEPRRFGRTRASISIRYAR